MRYEACCIFSTTASQPVTPADDDDESPLVKGAVRQLILVEIRFQWALFARVSGFQRSCSIQDDAEIRRRRLLRADATQAV
jgi:hypothetical protein